MLDVDAMRSDLRNNEHYYKKGAYTGAGRRHLAAIAEIEANQNRGLSYVVDDEKQTFRIVDANGNKVTGSEGRGVGVGERAGLLYGTLGRERAEKKHISQLMSRASNYYIQPSSNEDLNPAPSGEPNVGKTDAGSSTPSSSGITDTAEVTDTTGTTTESTTKKAEPAKETKKRKDEFDYADAFISSMKGQGAANAGVRVSAGPAMSGGTATGGGATEGATEETTTTTDGDGLITMSPIEALPEDWSDYEEIFNQNLEGLMAVDYQFSSYTEDEEAPAGKLDYKGPYKYDFQGYLAATSGRDTRLQSLRDYQSALQKGQAVDSDEIITIETTGRGKYTKKASEASLTEIENAISYEVNSEKNLFLTQAEKNKDAAIGYIQSEIDRINNIKDWGDPKDQSRIISYLNAKEKELGLKFDKLYGDVNEKSFVEFYGGADKVPVPKNVKTTGRFWIPEEKAIVKEDKYREYLANLVKDSEAKKIGGDIYENTTQKQYIIDHLRKYKKLYGDRRYDAAGASDQGRIAKMLEQLENPSSSKINDYDWLFPTWDEDVLKQKWYGELEGTGYIDFLNNLPTINKTPNNLKGDSWKMWKTGTGKDKHGNLMISYWNPTTKKIGQLKKINGTWVPAPKWDSYRYTKWNWGENELGGFSYYPSKKVESKRDGGVINNTKEMELSKSNKLVPRLDLRVQKAQLGTLDWETMNKISSDIGALSWMAKNPGKGYTDYAKMMGYEKDKKENTTIFDAENDGKVDPPTKPSGEDDMKILNDLGLYFDENGDFIIPKDNKKFGAVVSKTGINTPIGEIQYGDIANLIFTMRAKNRKVGDLPVRLPKAIQMGSRNVKAAGDMDASMLAKAENEIAKISGKNIYSGSDVNTSMIANKMAGEQKEKFKQDLIAKRAEYRHASKQKEFDELNLKASEDRADVARLVENENIIDRIKQDRDAKTLAEEARVQSMTDQNLNSIIQQIQGRSNADALGIKNLKSGLMNQQYQSEIAAAQKEIQSYDAALSQLRMQVLDAQQTNNTSALETLSKQAALIMKYKKEATEKLAKLNTIDVDSMVNEANIINRGEIIGSFKKGGKLIPRTK